MSYLPGVPYEEQPWGPPPPGVTPNFDNPVNKAYQVYITVAVGVSIMLPICVLRIYTRLRLTKNWGWDDTFIVTAMLFTVPINFIAIFRASVYMGRHAWDTRLKTMVDTNMFGVTYFHVVLYFLANLFIRTAILCLIIRLFGSMKKVRIIGYFAAGFIWVYHLAGLVGHCYIMSAALINPGLPAEERKNMGLNETRLLISFCAVNVAVDFFLIILPVYPVRKLYINNKSKWKIYAVFSTGFLGCVCAALALGLRISNYNLKALSDSGWTLTPQECCQTSECNIGIIVACLPLVAKYFRELIHRTGSQSSHFLSYVGSKFDTKSSSKSSNAASARDLNSNRVTNPRYGGGTTVSEAKASHHESWPMHNQGSYAGIVKHTHLHQDSHGGSSPKQSSFDGSEPGKSEHLDRSYPREVV